MKTATDTAVQLDIGGHVLITVINYGGRNSGMRDMVQDAQDTAAEVLEDA